MHGSLAPPLAQLVGASLPAVDPPGRSGLPSRCWVVIQAATWTREANPSLRRTFSTWDSTVRWEATSRAAICRFDRPCPIPATIDIPGSIWHTNVPANSPPGQG